jgi:hypothetical protein
MVLALLDFLVVIINEAHHLLLHSYDFNVMRENVNIEASAALLWRRYTYKQ